MVPRSPCLNRHQELIVLKKRTIGKRLSQNPLIVDGFLKTIWSSMHYVFTMRSIGLVKSKRLLVMTSPKSLLVASLLKTIWSEMQPCFSMKHWLVQKQTAIGESATDDIGESRLMLPLMVTPVIHRRFFKIHLKLAVQDRSSTSIPTSEILSTIVTYRDITLIQLGLADDFEEDKENLHVPAYTKFILRFDEVLIDEFSKKGRKLSDERFKIKQVLKLKLFIQEVTPTKVIQDSEGSEKGSDEVSTVMQERLSFAEAIKLEEQMNKQRAQIARDEEIARQWDEEERQRVMAEAKTSKKIDWNDPLVIRYHTQDETKDNEEEDVDTQEEIKEVVKETGAKRKKFIPRKSTRKRQKLEEDAEKEELKGFFGYIQKEVPRRLNFFILQFLIRIGRSCVLTKNFTDVEELYRLVEEKYSASRLEGFDLMLWGDLNTLFESGISNSYVDREEISFKSRVVVKDVSAEVEEMFERIISKGRRLEDLIQNKLGDLKDNYKFKGGLLGINLLKT
ncbi:hypothetical protein Tco_0769594 [Tanacetum coccineum]|uniref:Uncharacterized protein n=1 Tax=Tanacetum coccineum TaxID=301880 RepID=A0ABQ4ZDF7_9ASTR